MVLYKAYLCNTNKSCFIQAVLVRYVDDTAFICLNQNHTLMGHNISGVSGNYHENQVSNIENRNENQVITNNIYLHPGHRSGGFEDWMQKINGFLQNGAETAHLKPLLDLLIVVTEPERMFLYTLPAIDSHQLKSCHEIRLVFRDERIEEVSALEGFIKLASFKHQNVMITLQPNTEFEEDAQDWTNENVLCFREEFLVFSNSPYRIKAYAEKQIKDTYDNVLRVFNKNYEDAVSAFQFSKTLLESKNFYQAYWLVVRAIEQTYNAIIYPFEYSFHVGLKLSDLKKKAAKHLPQLFHFDYELIEIEELSLQLVDREKFMPDSVFGAFDNIMGIAEEFISAVKPCFESKLNYLLNYGKGT